MARLFLAWRNLLFRTRIDRDLDDELRATFDMLVDEKIQSGMHPDAAARAARLELGNIGTLKDQIRDVRAGAGVDTMLQDIRYALRLFRRTPAFTAVAVMTLALGIGANAAIFGVVKSVLLDSLPYADGHRLMRVYAYFLDGKLGRPGFSARVVQTIAARQRSFENLAAFDSGRDAVFGGSEIPRLTTIAWVEPQFFTTLGVSAALGRTFTYDDRAIGYVPASGAEVGPDTARAVVLTHAAWQKFFAGDPNVVGRDVPINGIQRTVIGVLPRGFVGPTGPVDFYFAFDLTPALATGAGWLGLVGRLKPGVSHDAAASEAAAIWTSREDRQLFGSVGISAMPLRDALVGSTRTPLLVLLASAAVVLLIACANLAGALLSRNLARRKEFAVRIALGAGRQRLVRQLLTEGTLLALAGGAAGLLLAQSMLSLLRGLTPSVLPVYARLSLDPGAVVVTAVLALGTGLAFSVVPALTIGRAQAHGALRDESRGASESRRPRRVRGVLVAVQVAFCASLLAGAGLLARSLLEMATTPLGFDSSDVLTARFRLSTRGYPTVEGRARFHEQLAAQLREFPGVDAVAIAHKVPTVDPRFGSFAIEGAPSDRTDPIVVHASVSDDYFRTLRIPLLQGRTFDASDRTGSMPTVVISDTMARRYWPEETAVGSRIRLDGDLVTIVGIVGDVRNDRSRPDLDSMVYRSHRQESTQRFCVLLRTKRNPLSLVPSLERAVAALDSALPVQDAMTLEAAVGVALAARRLPVMLMTAFGFLALLLASVGVYGMFASMAAAREREFGLRMALGSHPREIAGLMLRQGVGWMAAGLAGGAFGTLLIVQLLRRLVAEVPPFEPSTLAGAVAILAACAAIALLVPVRRAMRVDPVIALRAE